MTEILNTIRTRATDPGQYDGQEIRWSQEGGGQNHIRRMFKEVLAPHLGAVAGKQVLDLGCGQGWLCRELADRGAEVTGLDASERNIAAAQRQYPGLSFEVGQLATYNPGRPLDMVTAIMVFEHFADLPASLRQVHDMLRQGGSLLAIAGDYHKFTRSRYGYDVAVDPIEDGVAATRTDYGDRAGVIYDINRTAGRIIADAETAGFEMAAQQAITAPAWLLEEQPRYRENAGDPLFHLFAFEAA
jgi:SAM-dependent methyltransferase